MFDSKLLEYLSSDTISYEDVTGLYKEVMNAKKRREYLKNHSYKIYEGKDGRWYTRLPKPGGGSKQIAARTKEDIEKKVAEYYEGNILMPTVSEIFKTASEEKRLEGSISGPTLKRNSNDFIKYFSDVADRRIDSFDAEEVEAILRSKKAIFDLDAKGYGHLTTVARLIFRYAKRKGFVSFRVDDVISDMDWGKNAFRKEEKDESDEVFSDEEAMKLAEYFKTYPNGKHLGLLLIFATGLRIGELSALKWEDIDDGMITIRRTERSWSDPDRGFVCEVIGLPKTKAGKRKVPIPECANWIIEELRKLNSDGEYVFMYRGSRTRTVYFRKAMSKACDAVGIKRRSPHKIRKTYASILLDNNVAEKAVIENMGHTSINTTNESYARLRRTNKQRREVVDGIPEFKIVGL